MRRGLTARIFDEVTNMADQQRWFLGFLGELQTKVDTQVRIVQQSLLGGGGGGGLHCIVSSGRAALHALWLLPGSLNCMLAPRHKGQEWHASNALVHPQPLARLHTHKTHAGRVA